MEKGLMIFDIPFHSSTSAVDGLIDKRGAAALKTCDNKAQVLTLGGDLHLADDPPWSSPCACLIEERGEQANLLPGVMIQLPGLLQQTGRLLFQDLISGLTQCIIDVVVLTPVVNLGSTEMTIPTKEDIHLWPSGPDVGNQTLQDGYDLFSVGPLSRSKDGRDQFAALPFVDVKGEKTVFVVVAIEQGQLLVAMSGIVGVIGIENDHIRRMVVGVNERVDEGSGHAIEIRSGDRVFQSGYCRLAGQLIAGDGGALTGCFDERITPELIAVIGIFISTGDLKNPLSQQGLIGMIHIALMTAICQNIRQTLDQADASLYLTQEQNACIARQASTIKISGHFFTGNTCKREGDLCIFVHGSFLSNVFVLIFHNTNIIQRLRKGNCFFMNNSG